MDSAIIMQYKHKEKKIYINISMKKNVQDTILNINIKISRNVQTVCTGYLHSSNMDGGE